MLIRCFTVSGKKTKINGDIFLINCTYNKKGNL